MKIADIRRHERVEQEGPAESDRTPPLGTYVDGDDAHHEVSLELQETHPGPLIMDDATRADMAAYTGCIAGAFTCDEFADALRAAG